VPDGRDHAHPPSGGIGTSPLRADGLSKVTGSALYARHLRIPGMLHAALVRSDRPHARILAIRSDGARRAPGIAGVMTAADVRLLARHERYGPAFRDQPILASEVVRHVGEPVAAIVAETAAAAQAAVPIVEVVYEDLPGVFDPVEAMQPGAPLVHERVEPAGSFADLRGLEPAAGTNVCLHFRLRRGDVSSGIRNADEVVEETFTTPITQHLPMEPHAVVAVPEANGRLVIWSSTQSPSFVRSELAYLLGVSEHAVDVRVPYLGGGYGSKLYVKLEAVAAVLALRFRRPVAVHNSLEDLFYTNNRHATRIVIRSGVTRDGQLLARQVQVYWDTGAYADIGPRICQKSGYTASGPYRIPHVSIDSYCVYTNHPPAGAFRGFGIPQLVWAYESHTDTLARRLALDPVEFRRRNLLQAGDPQATGTVVRHAGFREVLDAVAQRLRSPRIRSGHLARGVGVAVGMKAVLTPSTSLAIVHLYGDGSAAVATSTVEMGQGAETLLSQIVATELGVPLHRVHVLHPDTDVTPFDTLTAGSRSTFHMGNAVRRAAQDVGQQLLDRAARLLEAPRDVLAIEDGGVVTREGPRRRLTFADIMEKTFGQGGTLVGRGEDRSHARHPDPATGQSDQVTAFWFSGAAGAEIELDTETGEVRVTHLVCAADVGKALHPRLVEGQIRGAAVMQLSQTLYEAVATRDGQLLNPNLIDYKVLTTAEAPARLDAVIVEVPHPDGPYGAKGVGETGSFAIAPAVANAIADATGRRVRDLPLTPQRILEALEGADT
jgi:CO/xanthine dehydrogenase Mo-binding subunit